jgi:acylphosphatase
MTARVFVFGFVQGVGFRQFVKNKAKSLNLKGYVQNLPDGRVEVVAQGPKEKIEQLIKFCEKGPFFSEVKSVQVEWEDEKEFSDFEIIK